MRDFLLNILIKISID